MNETVTREVIERLNARIEALILAGDGLAEYARHQRTICSAWEADSKFCECGCSDATAAWEKAKE